MVSHDAPLNYQILILMIEDYSSRLKYMALFFKSYLDYVCKPR